MTENNIRLLDSTLAQFVAGVTCLVGSYKPNNTFANAIKFGIDNFDFASAKSADDLRRMYIEACRKALSLLEALPAKEKGVPCPSRN